MNPTACLPASAATNRDDAVHGLRRGWQVSQDFLIRVFDRLAEWQDRDAGRSRLASLDDRMLRDIGVDRGRASEESFKPFWRP